MNENERENCIKKLVDIFKSIHIEVKSKINWPKKIKEKVLNCFEKTKKYFNIKEQNIILDAIKLYDKYLIDNHFSFINNDLHFDNIIKDSDKYYLIDFNDSCIAPFDYDLRILYMCKFTPWKWANIEMDPLQKKEDYINIDKYLEKYYTKLKNIKYLKERMIIYRILNDIELLIDYNNQDLKENIINYSKMLLDN